MGQMLILDDTGHTTLAWDAQDEASVREVREEFDRLIARGYAAFERSGGETTFERRLETFDPAADEILWVRPIVGG